MADNLKPEDRRKAMRAVKGKGTKLEKQLFSTLAAMHLHGWRQNAADIPGKPDVVFDKERLVIFIDGCFWHGCLHCNRKLPSTNRAYWKKKIKRNAMLAGIYRRKLRNEGWTVIRIWEHNMRDPNAKDKIRTLIRQGMHGI